MSLAATEFHRFLLTRLSPRVGEAVIRPSPNLQTLRLSLRRVLASTKDPGPLQISLLPPVCICQIPLRHPIPTLTTFYLLRDLLASLLQNAPLFQALACCHRDLPAVMETKPPV